MTTRTYVTICIYTDEDDPSIISDALGIEPDRTVRKGEQSRPGQHYQSSGWFLGSLDEVESVDVAVHIDWIYQIFQGKEALLEDLRNRGMEMRMWMFWGTSNSNGGPAFPRATLNQLATLGVELGIDIWPEPEDDDIET